VRRPLAVVTGANSGIGRATALHLAANGYDVVATVRDRDRASKLLESGAHLPISLVELDVADDDSVRAGFATIRREHGDPHVLVANAGVGGNGVVEETTTERLFASFDVNAGGLVRCVREALPAMRAAGGGCVVVVSSVIGRLAAVAQAPYVASKWAVEGLAEELAHEVAPFGIRVAIVEPGITRSSIFSKNTDAPNATGAYDAHYRRMFAFYAAGHAGATPAEEVASTVRTAIETDEPRLRWVCSWGGDEIVNGRTRMSDEEWIELGAHADDESYYAEFAARFGLDISSP